MGEFPFTIDLDHFVIVETGDPDRVVLFGPGVMHRGSLKQVPARRSRAAVIRNLYFNGDQAVEHPGERIDFQECADFIMAVQHRVPVGELHHAVFRIQVDKHINFHVRVGGLR